VTGEVLLCQECRQPVDLKKKYVVTWRSGDGRERIRVIRYRHPR
jgi:hypothetical protein